MTFQIEIGTEQLTFAHPFCVQSAPVVIPSVAALQHSQQKRNTHHRDDPTQFSVKILDKRERILELQKEIEDTEEAMLNREREEEDFDPEKGEEDLFDVVVPKIESDVYGLRAENEIEIKLLEREIVQLERKNTK